MRPPVKFKWRGIHHGYLGGFMWLFGVFFLYMNMGNGLDSLNIIYGAFVFVGILLVVDDIVEHTVTEDTPSRIVWEWILKR